jgi:hypothetical protein
MGSTPIDMKASVDERGHNPFTKFYDRFFERYTFMEFVLDALSACHLADEQAASVRVQLLADGVSVAKLSETLLNAVAEGASKRASGSCSPELLREALNCFLAEKVLGSHREALFSIRLGGISTRTIRNWKKDGKVYSAGSSKTLNKLFDRILPAGVLIDRKRLAWLWLAERLKLDDTEANGFLKNCMGEQNIYALDLYEIILRTVISVNNQRSVPLWGFFDAIGFGLELQEEIAAGAFLWRAGRDRVLEVLRLSPDGNARTLADDLSLIHEGIIGYMEGLDDRDTASRSSRETAITQMAEESYQGSLRPALIYGTDGQPDDEKRLLQDIKAQITQWAHDNRPYLQAAYLSGLLTVTGLLIDFAIETTKANGEQDIFRLFYFNSSRAVTTCREGRPGAEGSFPENITKMTSVLAYEEGVAFGRFAREKSLAYFERLLDAPSRISRRRLIEFYLLTRLHHSRQQELDFILARHHFCELGEGDEMLLRFFRTCDENPPEDSTRFAEALARFKAQNCRPSREKHPALDWPIQEKLFRWKYH